MKVLIDKIFEKDVTRITSRKILSRIAECIENVQQAAKIRDVNNCKKVKGIKTPTGLD